MFIVCILGSVSLKAQSAQVSGTIRDKDGLSLRGASIRVKVQNMVHLALLMEVSK